MNYTKPVFCRTQFSEGQVKRMWAYLSLSNGLNGSGDYAIQVKNVIFPGNSPGSGPSGNIVIESGELVINNPLEMLPGATIRVKKGASLVVNSTISGACGKMWRGIIVEGTTFAAQSAALQGKVTINSGGKIEHAEVGVDVQDINPTGIGLHSTGGGIVKITGGHIDNNIIGVRFGPYTWSNNSGTVAPNVGQFIGVHFATTDNYRGGNTRPTYLDLDGISGLKIIASHFQDLRTNCNGVDTRAIGIDSKNAGFRATSGQYENLYYGIRADELDITNGSFLVGTNQFNACYRGIFSISTSGFVVSYNIFEVAKPANCALASITDITGAELAGATNGFIFTNNTFDKSEYEPLEKSIGTECRALGEGLDNKILYNTYSNLSLGNRAVGANASDDDGLRYLCNSNESALQADFRIGNGGSIRSIQAGGTDNEVPTGNIFSGNGFTISNGGATFEYVYDSLDFFQRPDIGAGVEGTIFEQPVTKIIQYCIDSEPCVNCPSTEQNSWKSSFFLNKSAWIAKKAELPAITNPAKYDATLDTIRILRLVMNREGARILLSQGLDSLGIASDSIILWLEALETFQTDIRLAKHYFFSKHLEAFDLKWEQTSEAQDLTEGELEEYLLLDTFYTFLRPVIEDSLPLSHLSPSQTTQLTNWAMGCNERGFLSSILLWRNGIDVQPLCQVSSPQYREKGGTQAVSLKNSLLVTPNPANNYVRLSLPISEQPYAVKILDQYGRTLLTKTAEPSAEEVVLSLGNIPNGVYFISCRNSTTAYQAKIVIRH